MPSPVGYYFYLKSRDRQLEPGSYPSPQTHFVSEVSHSRRQTLGLLLMTAAICVPVLATLVVTLTLRLLA